MDLRFLGLILILSACSEEPLRVKEVEGPQLPQGTIKRLVVATSDFLTVGKLVVVESETGKRFEVPIHSDAIVRAPKGSDSLFVVNRLGADNVQRVSKATGAVESQVSFSGVPHLQDVAVVSEEEAYLSSFVRASLYRVNVKTGQVLEEVSLLNKTTPEGIPVVDADGSPELTWLHKVNGKLLIASQRLDANAYYGPTEVSTLMVLDLASRQIEKIMKLTATNPVTDFKTDSMSNIFVGEASEMGMQPRLDGGIERIDGTNFVPSGLVIREEALGGDILDFEMLGPNLAVASVSVLGEVRLVSFDPSTGVLLRTVASGKGFTFQSLALDRERKLLYVADRLETAPSIRVFDSEALIEKPDLKVNLTLPPYHLVLTD